MRGDHRRRPTHHHLIVTTIMTAAAIDDDTTATTAAPASSINTTHRGGDVMPVAVEGSLIPSFVVRVHLRISESGILRHFSLPHLPKSVGVLVARLRAGGVTTGERRGGGRLGGGEVSRSPFVRHRAALSITMVAVRFPVSMGAGNNIMLMMVAIAPAAAKRKRGRLGTLASQ